MPKYGTANFNELLDPKLTISHGVLNDVAWGELTADQKNELAGRLKKSPTTFTLAGAVERKWNEAAKLSGVTVDQLKLVDMDAHAQFQLLRKGGEFTPQGWFLYFWKEAKNSINEAAAGDKSALDEMARTLFVKKGGDIAVAPIVRAGQAPDADPDFESWLKRDPNNVTKFGRWLEILLKVGFRPYVASKDTLMDRRVQTGGNPSGDLACADNLAMAKEVVQTPFTWRCDSRPLKDLVTEGGFNTKGDQTKNYSATHGLREPWNPFSKAEHNQYYWFRKASKDNCKYTVVSVGLQADWRKVISFPRLCDTLAYGWPADLFQKTGGTVKPFAKLSKDDQQKVAKLFKESWMLPAQCMVDGQLQSQPVLLPSMRTYLYLLILGGVVINTNAIQGSGGFPEVGVKRLALKNIYGAVEVVRFHHGGDDPDGYTAFVVGTQMVENQGRTKRFQATESQLKVAFDSIGKQMGALNLAWASEGCTPVPAEFTYMGRRVKVIGFNKTAQPMQCSIIWP